MLKFLLRITQVIETFNFKLGYFRLRGLKFPFTRVEYLLTKIILFDAVWSSGMKEQIFFDCRTEQNKCAEHVLCSFIPDEVHSIRCQWQFVTLIRIGRNVVIVISHNLWVTSQDWKFILMFGCKSIQYDVDINVLLESVNGEWTKVLKSLNLW